MAEFSCEACGTASEAASSYHDERGHVCESCFDLREQARALLPKTSKLMRLSLAACCATDVGQWLGARRTRWALRRHWLVGADHRTPTPLGRALAELLEEEARRD